MTEKKYNKAIVIGGSIAGMMAAQIASDFCQEVIILDRDDLTTPEALRKGTPHAPHPHTLLEGGRLVMESLFPGLTENLLAAGNVRINATADLKWFHHGNWKYKEPIDLEFLFQSRFDLEKEMRKFIIKNERISLVKAKVSQLLHDGDSNTIKGVKTSQEELIHSDLVIDASGRNSKLQNWLLEIDCQVPKTTDIPINIKYQTRLYKRNPDEKTPVVIYPKAPIGRHSGGLFPILHDTYGPCWLACIMCREEEQLPGDLSGFMAFMKNLDQPDLYDKVQSLSSASQDVYKFHFKSNKWHHYEQLNDLPEGLFVIGDALAHINPIYGQGMSLAAQEAQALKETLLQASELKGAQLKYHKKAAKALKDIWLMVLLEDWRYPKTPQRPFMAKAMQWYTGRLHDLSAYDKQVTSEMYHVLHLLKPGYHLVKPSILAKVLFSKKRTSK
jgi:2-polyprenyl-6-methoxyphenol hydroxylase-like FAD-dependent oxidoreductase